MEGRKKPFTEFEKSFLINLIKQHASIVENKKIDGATLQKKSAAWAKIAEDFNASIMITQKVDIKQLKKFWNNSKVKSREAKTKENQRNLMCGGPAVPDLDPELVMGEIDDDYAEYWGHMKNRENISNISTIPKIVIQIEDQEATRESEMSVLADTPGPAQLPLGATKRRRIQSTECCTDHPSIENLKIQKMQQDLKNHADKFKTEMEHLKKMHEYELQMKREELEHKTRMYQLYEEEIKIKIQYLKNKNAT